MTLPPEEIVTITLTITKRTLAHALVPSTHVGSGYYINVCLVCGWPSKVEVGDLAVLEKNPDPHTCPVGKALDSDTETLTEFVKFSMLSMPCCHTQLCHVNPRLPNYCPECGTRINMKFHPESIVFSDDSARLLHKRPS